MIFIVGQNYQVLTLNGLYEGRVETVSPSAVILGAVTLTAPSRARSGPLVTRNTLPRVALAFTTILEAEEV